jgi:hypothetical protein
MRFVWYVIKAASWAFWEQIKHPWWGPDRCAEAAAEKYRKESR